MIVLRDGTLLDPTAIGPSDTRAYLAADGEVFVADGGRLIPVGFASSTAPGADGRESASARALADAAEPTAGVVSDWIVRVVTRLADLAIETAAYDGPWSYGFYGPIPRRSLSERANFLVGEGMYPSWRRWYVETGLLPHLSLARHAISEELAETLSFVPRELVRLLLRRSGDSCHEDAHAVLESEKARFPPSLTRQHAAASRRPSWLVHRILNGMLPTYLRRVHGDERAYDAVYAWNASDLDPASPYLLPSVTARLVTRGDDAQLDYLEFLYPGEKAPIRVAMNDGATPAFLRARARRVFCSVYLLAAELDRHIVLGHLLTEFVLVGVRQSLEPEHPIYKLLVPFLQYVDVANHIGDQLVWGERGVLVQGSAFTASGLKRHLAERMGAFDWKGFAPCRRALTESHYVPRVQAEFWRLVEEYVDDAFRALEIAALFSTPAGTGGAAPRFARQLQLLAHELEARSVPHQAYDGLDAAALFDASELSFKAAGKGFSRFSTLDELKALCSFTIYAATLGHGWANVRQYEEGGEIEYASFGLRRRVDSDPPADPADDSAWHVEAAPRPCDAANQLLQGYVLSNLPVATLVEERDGPREGDALLPDVLSGDASLGARVARLRSSFVRHAERNRTGVPDVFCAADAIPARPNA